MNDEATALLHELVSAVDESLPFTGKPSPLNQRAWRTMAEARSWLQGAPRAAVTIPPTEWKNDKAGEMPYHPFPEAPEPQSPEEDGWEWMITRLLLTGPKSPTEIVAALEAPIRRKLLDMVDRGLLRVIPDHRMRLKLTPHARPGRGGEGP